MTQIGVTKITLEKFSICDLKKCSFLKIIISAVIYNIGFYYFTFLFGLDFVPLRIWQDCIVHAQLYAYGSFQWKFQSN